MRKLVKKVQTTFRNLFLLDDSVKLKNLKTGQMPTPKEAEVISKSIELVSSHSTPSLGNEKEFLVPIHRVNVPAIRKPNRKTKSKPTKKPSHLIMTVLSLGGCL